MAILSNVRVRENGMESEVTTGISLMFLPFCEQDTVPWRAKTECAVFKYRRKRRSGDLMKLGGEGKERPTSTTRSSARENILPSVNIYTVSSLVLCHCTQTVSILYFNLVHPG